MRWEWKETIVRAGLLSKNGWKIGTAAHLASRYNIGMTLAEFAYLLDVEPKWVQNLAATLGGSLPYTLATAKRLAVARALWEAVGMPMPRAYAIAGNVLRRYDGSKGPLPVVGVDGSVVVTVDVYRILAAVNTGLSRLRTLYAPRRRGRPPGSRDAIHAAAAYGLDPGAPKRSRAFEVI